MNIDLSATLENALIQQLAKHAGEEWFEQNRQAIGTYNAFVESNGCFGDDYRLF